MVWIPYIHIKMKNTKNTASQTAAQVVQAIAGGNQDLATKIARRWVDKGDTLHFSDRAYMIRFSALSRNGLTFQGNDWVEA